MQAGKIQTQGSLVKGMLFSSDQCVSDVFFLVSHTMCDKNRVELATRSLNAHRTHDTAQHSTRTPASQLTCSGNAHQWESSASNCASLSSCVRFLSVLCLNQVWTLSIAKDDPSSLFHFFFLPLSISLRDRHTDGRTRAVCVRVVCIQAKHLRQQCCVVCGEGWKTGVLFSSDNSTHQNSGQRYTILHN